MQNPFSMSPQTLSALMGWINNQNDGVFWIKTLDGKQLYIGEEFETIWERPCQILYEHPKTWFDSLIRDDQKNILHRLPVRTSNATKLVHEFFFRIHVPGNQIKYIRDCAVKLYDNEGQFKAFAGIGQELKPEEWQKLYEAHTDEHRDNLFAKNQMKLTGIINSVLQKEFGFSQEEPVTANPSDYYVIVNNKPFLLSRREFQCLFYLASGKSAKQTGSLLFLSQRTVETYLDAIKRKLNCRTKLEILGKINRDQFMSCASLTLKNAASSKKGDNFEILK